MIPLPAVKKKPAILGPLPSLLAAATIAATAVALIRTAREPPPPARADIAVEHAGTATMTLVLGTKTGSQRALLTLRHAGSGTAAVSLPAHWSLREVRGGRLEDLRMDPPTFGLRRYHVPAGVEASFTLSPVPSTVLMHNPSASPLQVRVMRINLSTGLVREDRVLIQKNPTPLW